MNLAPRCCGYALLCGLAAATASAQADRVPVVEVRARAEDLAGIAQAASEGTVSAERLAAVPLLRPGEVLEMVPGLIATQHAGDGKANQYFLRGFNLDHGTDFATWVAGVPVNMPSHAHGQGYTDLNFVIPELVQQIRYRKGPYFAEDGDFSAAGSARIDYRRQLDAGLAQVTLGPERYARTLLADSPRAVQGAGQWLYGLELFHHDGPWSVPEHYRKFNGVLRYSDGSAREGQVITAMAYQGGWTSTDQVPQRALDRGLIGRYDSMDPSTGGETARYSLSAEWNRQQDGVQRKTQVWALQSSLDLWSNFSYCLSDASPTCATGDQFQQSERRTAAGAMHSRQWTDTWLGREVRHAWGLQARADTLAPGALYSARQRQPTAVWREDRVNQQSLGLWAETEVRWTPWLRSSAGLRGDAYRFRVLSSLNANSGQTHAALLSPRLGLVLGPWQNMEGYLNHGLGFHSNDARGTTARVDPLDPTRAVQPVSPLVRAQGEELGLRSEWLPGWKSTLAIWQLRMASELLFVGDAGTTEASRPSRRHGVEWNHFYALSPQWALDADLAWSQARFTDGAAAGPWVPGAATSTANLGLSWDSAGTWSGALRLRYWGARPLVEDNSWRAPAAAWVNLRVGYRSSPREQWSLDIYNLMNRKVNDIEYAYVSRLAGEDMGGQMDRHVHPGEPRSWRIRWTHRF
jgi:hypothetical protein